LRQEVVEVVGRGAEATRGVVKTDSPRVTEVQSVERARQVDVDDARGMARHVEVGEGDEVLAAVSLAQLLYARVRHGEVQGQRVLGWVPSRERPLTHAQQQNDFLAHLGGR